MLGRLMLTALLFSACFHSGPCLWAANERLIQQAIQRGVVFLKANYNAVGGGQHEVGAKALVGLALLECDAPATDDSVMKVAAAIRQAAPNLTSTYSLALAILFLDRLGQPEDTSLVQSFAIRLLAGQSARGGWDYACPVVEGAAGNLPSDKVAVPDDAAAPADKTGRQLSPQARHQLALLNQQIAAGALTNRASGRDDNSNTQFALLALWVARRHGVPVQDALLRVEQRFRTSHNADGGWAYTPAPNSTPSMTCAGLLGLAVGYGIVNEGRLEKKDKPASGAKTTRDRTPLDPARDRSVNAGLLFVASSILQSGAAQVPTAIAGRPLYFLWSLERTAFVYNLKTLGRLDWFAWGSSLLIQAQRADGSWNNDAGDTPAVDTAFALLFLSRSNLTRDLTAYLRGVRDPGVIRLRVGGVGGASLQEGKGLGSGLGSNNTSSDSAAARAGERPRQTTIEPGRPSKEYTSTDSAETKELIGRLMGELVRATPTRQLKILEQFSEGQSNAYTVALANAIDELSGRMRERARDLLVHHLERLPAATLRDKFADGQREIRRAAILASGKKADKQLVPDLIDRLLDEEKVVADAAQNALRRLTNEDFGPRANASDTERQRAIETWKAWWKQHR